MDLGIRGKKAIVCASSKGLGRGCAMALAEAGCDLVVNGRNADLLATTAAELRERYGVTVTEVAGDVSLPEIQRALLAACPEPDILVNNNGGPPFRDFRELDREKILQGVTNNMVTPIELIKAVIDGMADEPKLSAFNLGTDQFPDRSTTVIVQIAGLEGGPALTLAGPGIPGSRNIAPQGLRPGFTDELRENGALYPLGIDVLLAHGEGLIGLPRSTQVEEAR